MLKDFHSMEILITRLFDEKYWMYLDSEKIMIRKGLDAQCSCSFHLQEMMAMRKLDLHFLKRFA